MRSSVVPWTVPVSVIRTTRASHPGHTPLCLLNPARLSLQIRTYKSTLRPLNPHLHRLPVSAFSAPRRLFSSTSTRNMSAFYDLKAELPNGSTYNFAELKGKVVLIVNVASKCGFTPQYKGLQELYDKYKEKDFVILGFPCNQFGGQEPGDDGEIATFCERNHGVSFPLMKKSDVNGDNTNEVYKWLKNEKSGLLGLSRVKWNFEKFLIDKEGKVVQRWASTTTPQAIDAEVAKLV
ncbi:Glutathione peroxidase 2 [Cerrena zonata]|uniref:Glutathione peroxidase n=1 Tax=Cerrena zonata TaxID=2478898 RepID=A0AAW0GB48_9APHY